MFKKLFSSQLRVNMFSGFATTTINTVVMAVAYPLYLYFLGYEKYGVWLVLATVLTFVQLGNLGIGPAVMKLVAEEYGRGNIEAVRRYITTALVLLCVSGTVALIVILSFKSQIISLFKLSDENAKTVSWLLPYVGILSIYVFVVQVFDAALSGLGRMDLSNYIQSFGRIAAVIVAAVLLYSGRGIESLLISSIVSYVLIHIATIVCIWRIMPTRFLRPSNFDVYRCKRLLHFGGAVFGGSLISMLLSPFNKLMLSRYAGVSTVPIYEIAYTGSMQVRALIEAGLRALMPEISRIGADITIQAKNKISQLNSRVMKLILMFGIPIYGVLAIFAPLLLRIWLGGKFTETLPGAFRIMLIGTFLSLVGVPAYYTLMGTGHVRYTLGAHIAQAIINLIIILCILIVSTVSINVVVWSSSIAMAGATLYLILQKRRTLQRVTNGSNLNGTNKENIETVFV